jgi:hypothetical protein
MANRFIDDPAIEFHPTALVGTRRRCDGHEGSGE